MATSCDPVDLSKFQTLPLETFIRVSNSLLDEIIGQIPEPLAQLSDELTWTVEDLRLIKQQFLSIVIEAMYVQDEDRQTYFQKTFNLDKSEYLAKNISYKKVDIAKALMKQHNAIVKPVLDYFDWNVKWVLGNSSSTAMKYPLVELDLITICHKGNNPNISLQLDKSELDMLLFALES